MVASTNASVMIMTDDPTRTPILSSVCTPASSSNQAKHRPRSAAAITMIASSASGVLLGVIFGSSNRAMIQMRPNISR